MDLNGDSFNGFHNQNNAAAASNCSNGFGNLPEFNNQNNGVAASNFPETSNGYNNGKAAAISNNNNHGGFHQPLVAFNGDNNNGNNPAAASFPVTLNGNSNNCNAPTAAVSNYNHLFQKSPEAFNGYNNGKAAAIPNYNNHGGFHQPSVGFNGDNNNGNNPAAASNYDHGMYQSPAAFSGDLNDHNSNENTAAAGSSYNQVLNNELPVAPNEDSNDHNNTFSATHLSAYDNNDNTSAAVSNCNHVFDDFILDEDFNDHDNTLNATDVNNSDAASYYNELYNELLVAPDDDFNDHNNTINTADVYTGTAASDDNQVHNDLQVASDGDFNGHNNSNAGAAASEYNPVMKESQGGFNGDSNGNNKSEVDNNMVIDDFPEFVEMDSPDFNTWFQDLLQKTPAAAPSVSSVMNHTAGGQSSNQNDGFNGDGDGDHFSIGETFHSDSFAGSSVFPTNPNLSGQPQNSSSSLSLPLYPNMSAIPPSMASLSSQSNHPNLPNLTQIQLKGPKVDQLVSPPAFFPPPPQSLAKSDYLKTILECAQISHLFPDRAINTLIALDQRVSPVGDSSERLAFYFTRALYSWIYKLRRPVPATIGEKLEVYAILNRKCPFMKFAHLVANESLRRHVNEERIHIIDFGMVCATQWEYFLKNLPPRKSYKIRISGVVTCIRGCLAEGRIAVVGEHLSELAKSLGLNFKFNIILDPLESLNTATFQLFSKETVIVNFTFELYRLLEKSERIVTKFLWMVKSLNPRLVIMAEYELSLNKVPFLQRVSNAMTYYSAVFESVEARYGQEDPNRKEVERLLLGPRIADVFESDEGFNSVKRFEDKAGWYNLMKECGFSLLPKMDFPVSRFTGKLNEELSAYHPNYTVEETAIGFLSLAWKKTELVTVSSWRL